MDRVVRAECRRIGMLSFAVVCICACGASPSTDSRGPSAGHGGDNPFGNLGTGGSDFGNVAGRPSGTGGSGTTKGTGCAHVDVNVERLIPSVTLVVDGSGSMNAPFGGGTRWTELRSTLADATNGLVAQLEGTVEFGLAIYSRRDANNCPTLVQVPGALNNFMAIDSMYPMNELGGGTPTGEALQAVVSMLPDVANPAPDAQVKPEIMILATDGQPNGCGKPPDKSICPDVPPLLPGFPAGPDPFCVANYFAMLPPDYQGTVDAVRAAQMKGIDTYTISLAPGEQEKAQLQRVANVGLGMDEMAMPGAPIFEPTDAIALRDTLLSIIGGAVGCQLELQGKLIVSRACEGDVMLNGKAIECNAADGWKLNDETHIELVGAACKEFIGNPSASVSARWPCDVLVQ